METRFIVTVEFDPKEIESESPSENVVADEIASNLNSVDYVESCTVGPLTEPHRGATPDGGINQQGSTHHERASRSRTGHRRR
jgi:hypothetical protein